jgi:diguanylate cyclase (GGDEF)-like protein
MSLLEIATAAHLAGTVVLALFFVLLERHDPRPYLRDWMAAWIVQLVALAALLVTSRRDWQTGLALYLFLETAHGILLWLAAVGYARGPVARRWRVRAFIATAAWAAAGPFALDAQTLYAAQFTVLAVASFAAAFVLWPRREHEAMGVRLTTWLLVLLGVVYLADAGVGVWAIRPDGDPHPSVGIAPFTVLLLQTLMAFGMVLAVMEEGQQALHSANDQLLEAERRLKTLAETDHLTGCFNRRVFRNLVDDLRRGEGPREGTVVMLDMDGLKAINDREGHAAGDSAIRAVADAIRAKTRNTDVAVRWGGDEFLVVLPGLSETEGTARRDQITAGIAAGGLSASTGVAPYGEAVDIMDAVEAADASMYAVKAERRGSTPEARKA